MIISDKIWGTFVINEPVLVELINSPPVQRLKKVNQAGAPKYIHPWKTVTRYDHSIGVMLLLRKFAARLEEQIAGLLHDVPHTAFSHTIDLVFENKDHEYHEKHLEEIILNSNIPLILRKYSINVKSILDKNTYPLLERKIPDLCADRLDYFLRDEMSEFGITDLSKKTPLNLTIKNKQFVFKDKTFALKFAQAYLNRDTTTWSHPREISSAKILAEAIKKALDNREINQDDLFTDDDTVERLLRRSLDPYIQAKLKLLTPALKIKLVQKNYDFHLVNKLRFIDPQILLPGEPLVRVSEIYPEFKRKLLKHNLDIKRGSFVKIPVLIACLNLSYNKHSHGKSCRTRFRNPKNFPGGSR